MKRMHWWTMLGLSGAGLLAALLGPAVWGQPGGKVLIPPPPPGSNPPPERRESDPLLPLPTPTKTESFVEKQALGSLSFDVPPGKQQPAVSLEWVGPTAIRVRQPMACQILVRNASTAPAQNVIVRHRLGKGVLLKASEPQATIESGELVWNLGTLSPEQMRRIDLTLVAENRGPINCHATVTFTAVAGHQVQVREPQLAVKMKSGDKAILGESATLAFTVSNPGDGIADQVKVKVMLPEGLEHAHGRMVDFEVGSLAPKEVRNLQMNCVARGTGAQKCMIAASAEGNLAASDFANVEILIPKLDIAIAGPKLRYLYRHAIYTLKVTNPGTAPASNVEVHELVPAGFRMHQANGGQYLETTRVVSWKIGDLQPGQSKEVSLDLIPTEIGEHRLAALAKTGRGLKSEAETCTTVEGLSALEMEVNHNHVDDTIEVGAETAFEIRIANKGTKTETDVEIVCTLPEQLEFVAAKCTTALRYRQVGRELIFDKMPRLAPRAEEIFKVQVKGSAPGDIRFKTRLKADGLRDPVLREDHLRVYSDDPAPRPAAPMIPTPMPPNAPPPAQSLPTLPVIPAPSQPLPPPLDPQIPLPTPPGL